MGSRDLEQRESLSDPLWRKYERVLLNRIEYRERELAELSEDYLALEQRCNALWGVIARSAKRDREAIAERKRMDAANEAAHE